MQQFPLHFVSSILTALKKLDDLSSGICLEMGGSGGPQEAPSLWRALGTAANVTVNHSECDTRGLKTVCRIAEAFPGESWTLDSFEEKERFIRRGQLALALSRASLGPGLRVFFRLDSWQSGRLKWFIRDLLNSYFERSLLNGMNFWPMQRLSFRWLCF